jgi:hypothetical protein
MSEYKPFSQWDAETKQNILDLNRNYNVTGEFWYESTIDGIKQALELIGFYDVNVYFSGFFSQGDGAQFVGSYSYEKGALSKAKKQYPQWGNLHQLAAELQNVARKYFYNLPFTITNSGHYSHEYCTSFSFDSVGLYDGWISDDDERTIIECCREFMQSIYSSLEKEYEYLTADETLIEYFTDNEDLLFNGVGDLV